MSVMFGKSMLVVGAVASIAGSAAAGTMNLNYVGENFQSSISAPGTWTISGTNLHVALLGFSNGTDQGQVVTPATIQGDILTGGFRVESYWNGVGNLGGSLNPSNDPVAYESTTFFGQQFDYVSGDNLPYSNGIEPLTGIDLNTNGFGTGRYVSAFFMVFEGTGNVVFGNDTSGTTTIAPNGVLGEFPAEFVPAPGAFALAGLAGVAAVRRKR